MNKVMNRVNKAILENNISKNWLVKSDQDAMTLIQDVLEICNDDPKLDMWEYLMDDFEKYLPRYVKNAMEEAADYAREYE